MSRGLLCVGLALTALGAFAVTVSRKGYSPSEVK